MLIDETVPVHAFPKSTTISTISLFIVGNYRIIVPSSRQSLILIEPIACCCFFFTALSLALFASRLAFFVVFHLLRTNRIKLTIALCLWFVDRVNSFFFFHFRFFYLRLCSITAGLPFFPSCASHFFNCDRLVFRSIAQNNRCKLSIYNLPIVTLSLCWVLFFHRHEIISTKWN